MSEPADRGSEDPDAVPPNVNPPPAPPKRQLPSWVYVSLGVVAASAAYGLVRVTPKIPGPGVGTRSFASATRAPWQEQGFVEMVPPLRLPGRADGSEKIEVWVKFPAQGKLGVRWIAEQKRHALTYPPGTVADRLEIMNGRNIVDVRGTDLGEGGDEVLHVYRPNGHGLYGFTWKRGDAAAQSEATRVLLANERSDRQRERHALEINNDCGGCHVHAREERRNAVPGRAGDAVGWYVPETILRDRAPVESHRPKEMNVDDPFVRFECPSPTDPAEVHPATFTTRKNGTRWPACPDNLAPIGILDLPRALAAGDEHAQGLCTSRRALYDHMDDEARAAFKSAFEVCSIQ